MIWILIMFSMPIYERTSPEMRSVEFTDLAACEAAKASRIRFIQKFEDRSVRNYQSARIDFECVPKGSVKNQRAPAN